jgi:hypothetical protein
MRQEHTYEKEERGEAKAKYEGARKVGVVHYALVDSAKGI